MLEKILHWSIQNRWLVVLLTLLATVAGAWSLTQLPIDAVPDITNNQVQINTLAASLSPVEVEKQVTFPMETALAGIPGLQSTRSLSRNGFSQITAVFDDDVDIYFARNQVNERLGAVRDTLPVGAQVSMGPIATGLGEIYMWTVAFQHPSGEGAPKLDGKPGWQTDGSYLTPEGERLTSEVERAAYLRTLQDWLIRPQLKGVAGVAGIDAIGGFVKQYHVQPDPMKLVSFGLTFHDVITALEQNNVSTGAGYVEHKGEAYLVRATGRLEDVAQIASVPVGTRNGTPILMKDVATVGIGRELRTGTATEDGQEVVVGTALMRVGANSRVVSGLVDAKMAEIRRGLPPDIAAKTVLNRTALVQATIDTVAKNLAEGALLVIAVLFLFLGNLRAALITALAIPISMALTAIGMVKTGISGNLMSLGAIDFGLIVDGAVIIVENCLRRLAQEQHRHGRLLTLDERLETVRKAAKEVRGATAFGEAIIIIVYLPLLALTGVEGKMFQPMAMTVIFALVAAFVLSLTFVPAMVALVVSGRVEEKDNLLVRTAKRVYEPLVRLAVARRRLVVGLAVALFVASVGLFATLGSEFIPTLDEKDLAMNAMRIPSTSLTQSTKMQREVERTLKTFAEVAFVYSKTGTAELASDPMPVSISDTFVIFKPKPQWPNPAETKEELISRLETALAALPGNNYEFTQPIQMRFNELIAGVRSDVAVKVYGDDFAAMRTGAEKIALALRKIDGATAVKVEQTEGVPVLTVHVDRAAVAQHGLTVAQVQEVVATAVGGREAGLVFEGDRRFELVVRMPDALRSDYQALQQLPVPLPKRELAEAAQPVHLPLLGASAGQGSQAPPTTFVPLGSLAHIEIADGTNQVSRENGKRRVVVQCNVRGRDLGSFVAEAQAAVASVELPPGGWLEWGGQYENLVAARERLALVVPACFLLIFLLLYATFRSVRQALLVYSGVPLGLSGGVVALWLRGMPFSITASVGFIALSGVAVLNGLVMVSFINQLRAEGASVDDAVIQGSLTRLRPVMTTALVASLGFLPMALATGTGAEVQKPLATVVIGGLLSSTLLTLVVLPALYRWVGVARLPAQD